MNFDSAKIDTEIERLQAKIERLKLLKGFISDPETSAFLLSLTKNGDEAEANRLSFAGKEGRQETETETTTTTTTIHSKGYLLMTVRRVARSFDEPWYTAYEVMKRMASQGFMFEAAEPRIAVNAALRKLEERGQIKIYRLGSGRRPTKYRNLEDTSSA